MQEFVTVQFLSNGVVVENETEEGVLFGDDKVLVTGKGEIGIYHAMKTDKDNVYLVDLDTDELNYLDYDSEIIINKVLEKQVNRDGATSATGKAYS